MIGIVQPDAYEFADISNARSDATICGQGPQALGIDCTKAVKGRIFQGGPGDIVDMSGKIPNNA